MLAKVRKVAGKFCAIIHHWRLVWEVLDFCSSYYNVQNIRNGKSIYTDLTFVKNNEVDDFGWILFMYCTSWNQTWIHWILTNTLLLFLLLHGFGWISMAIMVLIGLRYQNTTGKSKERTIYCVQTIMSSIDSCCGANFLYSAALYSITLYIEYIEVRHSMDILYFAFVCFHIL